MATSSTANTDIKQVPQDSSVREAMRRLAAELAAGLDPAVPPSRETLDAHGRLLLHGLALPEAYLGFAMVALDNAFWRAHFAAISPTRRLLLLPKCLSARTCCAPIDTIGLHCQACGACGITDMAAEAEELGYQVVVAEGTSSVILKVFEGQADAILGVACLDSLDQSFTRIAELGIPHQTVPLLTDGCSETQAESAELLAALHLYEDSAARAATRTYLPLIRVATGLFEPPALASLLAPVVTRPEDATDLLTATDTIALDWLQHGGKRLRPFVTLAAYAVGLHGEEALQTEAVADLLPPAVRRVAIAIEALHKASLVHDDLEDRDAFRYGRPTLHQTYGDATAINIGDYLVGLGYRLIAGESATLGAACVADLLNTLAAAHLDLCRGQGAELLWQRQTEVPRPRDVLAIYALKTAPAFEVALYAGLRASGVDVDRDLLRRFCIYLGEGYQILNDLADWDEHAENKVRAGSDVLARRPTLLRAFAADADAPALAALSTLPADAVVAAAHALYTRTGAFTQAERLLDKLRERAVALADGLDDPAQRALLGFLARMLLAPGAD